MADQIQQIMFVRRPEGTEFAVTAQPAVNPARFTAFAAPPGMTGGKAGDDPLPDGRILLVCNSICFVGIVEGGSSRIVVEAACTTASGNGSSLIGGTSDAWFLLVEDLGPVTVGGL